MPDHAHTSKKNDWISTIQNTKREPMAKEHVPTFS
jgi:hypothetical protein